MDFRFVDNNYGLRTSLDSENFAINHIAGPGHCWKTRLVIVVIRLTRHTRRTSHTPLADYPGYYFHSHSEHPGSDSYLEWAD